MWPPRLELEPPPGCDGGGDVVDPPGELDEPPGLDAVEALPGDIPDSIVHDVSGMEMN